MTTTLVLLLIAALVGAVAWKDGEARRLAESRDRWRQACMRTRAEREQQRAENRRLRHRLAATGIEHHQTRPGRDGWPNPLPGDLRWDWPAPAPRPPLDPTDPAVFTVPAARWAPTPDPLAWCWDRIDPDRPDPDGELIGCVFRIDPRLITTSELDLTALMGAA